MADKAGLLELLEYLRLAKADNESYWKHNPTGMWQELQGGVPGADTAPGIREMIRPPESGITQFSRNRDYAKEDAALALRKAMDLRGEHKYIPERMVADRGPAPNTSTYQPQAQGHPFGEQGLLMDLLALFERNEQLPSNEEAFMYQDLLMGD